MKLSRTMTFLTAAALITGALLLLAGCEKEKPQKEETHNPLCGTTWVEYGTKRHVFYDNYDTDTIIESYNKDTFWFSTDNEVWFKTMGGLSVLSNYQLLEDTLILFSNIGGPNKPHNWKQLDNNHILIRDWMHLDISGSIEHICLKRIDYEN